ncbi:MAG: hypothetical protein K2P70_04530 [Hyphomonadaceae bacterium]|nr:hypothetical protein [Hyphomonadaceae bacterium]
MFAPEVERWLKSNSTPHYRQFVEGARSETATLLQDIGISANSELAHFYTRFGAWTCRGWYDLNEPDQIAEATQYAQDELGVPAGFVALTGFEGEGVVLYALKTGEVYDVELHRLEQLLDGSLAPIARTFEGYLRWCMSQQEKR